GPRLPSALGRRPLTGCERAARAISVPVVEVHVMDEHADVEQAVRRRYTDGARAPESELCCPTSYDPALLEAIPQEVLARDYGCGDPTRHLRPGETVLDLGSGSGKACFLVAQVVGAEGRVIGVDLDDEMLALARRPAPDGA